MRNKCRFFVVSLIVVLMFPNITVFAENKEETITAEELTEKIYVNLAEYKEIELNDKKSKLDDYTVKRYLEEAERQIESNDKNIEQAESKLNSIDISREEKNQCRYQIEYFKIYNFELQKNKCYYEMQNKLSELYEEYSDKIVENQKNKLKYETYKALCEINAIKSQKEYFKMLLKQKKSELTIVQESFKIGYATENEFLTAKSEYETAKSELLGCESNYNILVKRLEKESGNNLCDFSLSFYVDEKIEIEEYLTLLKKKGFYGEYYLKQSEIYGEYSKLLDELTKQMDKEYKQNQYRFLFKDNEDFFDRTYKYISDEKNYYENESKIFKLSSEKYSPKLELYVAESCENINTLLLRRTAKLAEIKAAENSYTIAQKLLNEGRINELNLIESQSNLQKVRYELLQIETEILVIKFALDNGIIV